MAVEGAVAAVETPASPSPSQPSGGAASDPKAHIDAGGKPAASQPEPKWEDDPRVKGMLADLKKEREARQTHERKLAEYEGTLNESKRRIAALAGITTPDPKQADAESIRAKILELMPELADVGSIQEMKAELEKQQVAAYEGHSKGMIGQIHQRIAAEYGDLNPAQKKLINNLYFAANYNDPALHERHNAGDPTLIDEFVKELLDGLVEPIKRKTAASEASRFRPVPGGRDRSTPVKGEKLKEGADMLRAHFRAHR